MRKNTSIYFILALFACLTFILTKNSFSQTTGNQPFVIKSVKSYAQLCKKDSIQGLIPLKKFFPTLLGEVPYQSSDNFTGRILYHHHQFLVLQETGRALRIAQDSLLKLGYSLYFFDTYRPYTATVKMWEIVPDDRYAANPATGSGHNRGVSVDCTLADLATGKKIPMPTGFDNFSDSAHHDFRDLPTHTIQNRAILKSVMEYAGFKALSTEWWHYSLPNPTRYPLLDIPFNAIKD